MTRKLPDTQQLIDLLQLQPLSVEGSLFVQTYRNAEQFSSGTLPARYPDLPRSFGTAILYLLTPDPDSFSALHWLPTDEVYHFYLGDPVEMLLLYPDGTSRSIHLGQDLINGQYVQFTVPRGVIQGSRLLESGRLALMGTTMAPGFDETDYHGCTRQELIARYPMEAERICLLTREDRSLSML